MSGSLPNFGTCCTCVSQWPAWQTLHRSTCDLNWPKPAVLPRSEDLRSAGQIRFLARAKDSALTEGAGILPVGRVNKL